MIYRKYIFILLFVLTSCVSHKTAIQYNSNSSIAKQDVLKSSLKHWHYKDIAQDSIPGISTERAYRELIKDKKGKEIIVAVIDTQMDIYHEDYKNAVWTNMDEIANNGIDDDSNGYVDDVHGWNFISSSEGESTVFFNMVYTRIVKKFKNQFEEKTIDSFSDNKDLFLKYQKALERLNYEKKRYDKYQKKTKNRYISFNETEEYLATYFPDKNFKIKDLESYVTKDSILQKNIDKMLSFIKRGFTKKRLEFFLESFEMDKKYFFNTQYNGRLVIGDNVEDIHDDNYGFHNVNVTENNIIYHATYVAGLLVADKDNEIGINGVAPKNTKILPIVVACEGDEYDKDIALAIRYAVDNGAKIINMSFKKDFEMHNNWVIDAIKYAKKHNVLLVKAAGNDNQNLDLQKNGDFPNDYDNFGKEYVNNFINVGASTRYANKNLKANFSNYGKNNVDLFAPGDNIYTTSPLNEYKFKNGTSLSAPIVSGVAALVWSHYPNLKANEIKNILMESGVSYDIDVEIYILKEKWEKILVPFSSLSKSGKIVNAYNALLMAEEYVKKKKK